MNRLIGIANRILSRFDYGVYGQSDLRSFNALLLREWLDQDSLRQDPLFDGFIRQVARDYRKSRSQIFQDLFVISVLGERPGVFVEIGAADGLNGSNSYLLEKDLGWRGLLCEPARGWKDRLQENRPGSLVDHRCVFDRSGSTITFLEARHREHSGIQGSVKNDMHWRSRRRSESYQVDTVSLDDVLEQYFPADTIDYISLDTEGSELTIVEAFQFGTRAPLIWTVEHNFTDSRDKLDALFRKQGYRKVLEQVSAFDSWYVREDQKIGE